MKYNRSAARNRKDRKQYRKMRKMSVFETKKRDRETLAKRMGFKKLSDVRELYGRLSADEHRRTSDLT